MPVELDTPTILIADYSPLYRRGVLSLLNFPAQFIEQGVDNLNPSLTPKPSLAILGSLYLIDKAEFIRMLNVPTIVILDREKEAVNDVYLKTLVSAGVTGFLSREAQVEEFVQAVDQVRNYGAFVAPELRSIYSYLGQYNKTGIPSNNLSKDRSMLPNGYADPGLSPREVEVVYKMACGMTLKQIAKALKSTRGKSLSRGTVANQITAILNKVEMAVNCMPLWRDNVNPRNGVTAVRYALASGLISMPEEGREAKSDAVCKQPSL